MSIDSERLVAGGQGRPANNVTRDGSIVGYCICMAIMVIVLALCMGGTGCATTPESKLKRLTGN